jgi:hypothetical protein
VLAAATKELQLRILDLVNAKKIILNDVQDAASHRAVIRVYDEAGNVIRVHEEAHSNRLFMLDSRDCI